MFGAASYARTVYPGGGPHRRGEKEFAFRGGPPQVLRCDNGPEFISEA